MFLFPSLSETSIVVPLSQLWSARVGEVDDVDVPRLCAVTRRNGARLTFATFFRQQLLSLAPLLPNHVELIAARNELGDILPERQLSL